MSEKLIDALNKLDVTNDNHWTTDGMPRLETVRMLSGNSTLTRDDITKANPGFSRSLFAQNGPILTPVPEMKPAVLAEEPALTVAPQAVIVQPVAPQETVGVATEQVTDELQDAQAQLALLDANLNECKRKRDAQQKVVDAILDAKDKEAPQHSYAATQGYLESQKRALEQRAERVRAVQNSGVDLRAMMASVAKSPLDVAMARKNSRGSSRPGAKK